ncbi:MAG: hypothetical protein LBQ68_05840 [Clostridiales bacterium]|jgi:uncharacterized membrane protein YcgQ (UPF0703/DUF1980 family)|nr:hypothetical protein [Clostridiales bacterium]
MKKLIPILFLISLSAVVMLTGCSEATPQKSYEAESANQDGFAKADKSNLIIESEQKKSADADNSAAPEAVPENNATPAPNDAVPAIHGEFTRPDGEIIEIKEKLFVAQANDVYYNTPDYLGKTFKYEGIFNIVENLENGEKYYSVIRYGPGCCGIDQNVGFEVYWDKEFPKQGEWVECVGVLEEFEDDGIMYLHLLLDSLTVKQERGLETVTQ